MNTDATIGKTSSGVPLWYWAVSGPGLAWNLFGAVQFFGSLSATASSLRAQGMTAGQAAVLLGYPTWMTVAFAVGVFGGVLGCVLLLWRKSAAVPVFAVSLAGYLALYAGDIVHGVFVALGTPQVAVLTAVVLIAASLLWFARKFRAQAVLT